MARKKGIDGSELRACAAFSTLPPPFASRAFRAAAFLSFFLCEERGDVARRKKRWPRWKEGEGEGGGEGGAREEEGKIRQCASQKKMRFGGFPWSRLGSPLTTRTVAAVYRAVAPMRAPQRRGGKWLPVGRWFAVVDDREGNDEAGAAGDAAVVMHSESAGVVRWCASR